MKSCSGRIRSHTRPIIAILTPLLVLAVLLPNLIADTNEGIGYRCPAQLVQDTDGEIVIDCEYFDNPCAEVDPCVEGTWTPGDTCECDEYLQMGHCCRLFRSGGVVVPSGQCGQVGGPPYSVCGNGGTCSSYLRFTGSQGKKFYVAMCKK